MISWSTSYFGPVANEGRTEKWHLVGARWTHSKTGAPGCMVVTFGTDIGLTSGGCQIGGVSPAKGVCEKAKHISNVILRSAATRHLGKGHSRPRQILRFAQNDMSHAL